MELTKAHRPLLSRRRARTKTKRFLECDAHSDYGPPQIQRLLPDHLWSSTRSGSWLHVWRLPSIRRLSSDLDRLVLVANSRPPRDRPRVVAAQRMRSSLERVIPPTISPRVGSWSCRRGNQRTARYHLARERLLPVQP